jgi:stage II sporulation protein D
MMKRLSSGFLLAAVSVLSISTNASAATVPLHFVLTGSGFGHGVGMSQIGAQGQAMEGQDSASIINYWFPGTSLVPVPDNQLIQVNIGHQLRSATIAIAKGFPASNIDIANPDGTLNNGTLGATGSTYKFSVIGKKITASLYNKGSTTLVFNGQSLFNLYWTGTSYFPSGAGFDPFTVVKVGTASGSIQLRYGKVQLKIVGGKMEITDTMTLEQYVLGISEMSSSWLPAALQAQAIASRTYGFAHQAIHSACSCNVYSTTRDQAYIGYAKESEPAFGVNWKSAVATTEVDPTQASVIEYQSKPISVYFFSSDGGRTQSSADVWGTALPYLTNVPDPWSLDIFLNPQYAHWQRVLIQKDVAAAFALPDVITLAITSRTLTNSATLITATSSTGATTQLSVGVFKTKLRIPSSWFEIAPNTF